MESSTPSLSVIIPVHNGEGWIGRCIDHVLAAIENARIADAEVIVVDDGSNDGTFAEVESIDVTPGGPTVRVLSQANSGRFQARFTGLQSACSDYVLFIDTRVFLDPDALAYVFPLLDDPSSSVWTAHVEANTALSPIAGFWQAIEHAAWRRYWKRPRRLSFGLDDFDFYPKGTTALLGPRDAFVAAFEQYEPTVDDWHISNDDTAVLRFVASARPINIAPGYRALYNSRTTLRQFLRHGRHRGAVLIDGYLRPGARFSSAIVVVLGVSPFVAALALRHPKIVLPGAVAGSVAAGGAVWVSGARGRDAVVVTALAVPFGLNYIVGMWRGLAARVRATVARDTAPR